MKNCFGNLNRVFPIGRDGLREVPKECLDCEERVQCMKTALNSPEGIRYKEELIRRRGENSIWDRLKRWSYRKTLHRMNKGL
ncbi:MAG TPA: hypothetical protein ENF54_01475 [Desulfobacteraceae bacterium]|nr:hypothetical protein [Desulfobacteraceae bacterium]